jgi:GNAT superfamily N-acetyltransferase
MRTARVNPENPKARATLDYLQALCFPYDVACEYRPADLWWIVYDAGHPVAFCCTRPTTADPAWWYLARAGVLPAARGKGIQKRMLRTREHAARKAGALVMVTDCTNDNYASANSLMGCGYRLYNPAYRWGLPNSLYWRKALC